LIKKFSKLGQIECGLAEAVAGKAYAFVAVLPPSGLPPVGLGVAFANEAGYMAVPSHWCCGDVGDFDAMSDHADELNAEIGLDVKAAAIIVGSSMFPAKKLKKPCGHPLVSFGAGTREDPDRCVDCGALFERDADVPFALPEQEG
jgi:hypothetical protein